MIRALRTRPWSWCARRARVISRPRASCTASIWACCASALLCAALCAPSVGFGAAPGFAFVYPIVRPRISSTYGLRRHPIFRVRRHHKGVDLVAPIGTPIRAIAAGRVIFADPYAGYGNLIVIEHHNGMTSHYGHLLKIKAEIGKNVNAGQIIGLLGSTGSSTGPHLHLEIRKNGSALDPMQVIPGLQAQAQG